MLVVVLCMMSGTHASPTPTEARPVRPAAGPTVTSVSAGVDHTCARTSDGAAWCWGGNGSGQLGDGTTTASLRPVRVTKKGGAPLAGVTAVSAGFDHTCARTSDGAAWCWGQNYFGELGDGTTTDRHRAVRVTKSDGAPPTGVTAVSAGVGPSCARTSDGAAWCWGGNWDGGLGDGTTTHRSRAVRVTRKGGANLTGVTAVSAGDNHSCGRADDGAGWCWGANWYGQLGDGTTEDRTRAVRVTMPGGAPLTGSTGVTPGGTFSCSSTAGGAAWCWGGNWNGELGDGTTTHRSRAVRVTKIGGAALNGVTEVGTGGMHSCARRSDGTAWCWGSNWAGRLGDGSTTDRHRAIRVTKKGGASLTGVTAVSAGDAHSCARGSDGTVWCWGSNMSGQLGDGTTTERPRAVRVVAGWAP
jgi:alpha-tubulin suppressor-like RCC1 family protein